jgi:hypothetical protein
MDAMQSKEKTQKGFLQAAKLLLSVASDALQEKKTLPPFISQTREALCT